MLHSLLASPIRDLLLGDDDKRRRQAQPGPPPPMEAPMAYGETYGSAAADVLRMRGPGVPPPVPGTAPAAGTPEASGAAPSGAAPSGVAFTTPTAQNVTANGYQAQNVVPEAVDIDGYRESKPTIDSERYNAARRGQLVAALIGGGAMLAGGPQATGLTSAIGALGAGAAVGFGTEAAGMEDDYQTRLEGYEKGLAALMEEDRDRVWDARKTNASAENSARGKEMARLGAVEDRDVRERGSMARAQMTQAGQDRRHQINLVQDQAENALKAGNVAGYVSLLGGILGEDVAREIAADVKADLDRAESREEQELALARGRLRVQERNAATSERRAATAEREAARRRSSGGPRRVTGTTASAEAVEWHNKEQLAALSQYNRDGNKQAYEERLERISEGFRNMTEGAPGRREGEASGATVRDGYQAAGRAAAGVLDRDTFAGDISDADYDDMKALHDLGLLTDDDMNAIEGDRIVPGVLQTRQPYFGNQ